MYGVSSTIEAKSSSSEIVPTAALRGSIPIEYKESGIFLDTLGEVGWKVAELAAVGLRATSRAADNVMFGSESLESVLAMVTLLLHR